MQKLTIAQAVGATSYPGRGILAGKTPDGTRLFLAYFIMGQMCIRDSCSRAWRPWAAM